MPSSRFTTYLRRLAEPQNSSLGFVISTFANIEDDMPPTITRPDVRSRVGASNYMEIPPLPSVEDVKGLPRRNCWES